MRILRPELLVDIVWLAFSISYVIMAFHYPPAGRLVPVTVGSAGIALGLVHFFGNFVKGLRPYTHGDGLAKEDAAETLPVEGESWPEAGDPLEQHPIDEPPRYLAAIAWALGLVLGIYLIGAIWIMPIFFILYFGLRGGRWGLGVLAAVFMTLVTWGLFGRLIELQLPAGVITQYALTIY